MYSCHLFLICSASVRSLHFCYHDYPCMKHSLDISSFLEEISSLSHSIFFLYFFSLFIQESLLISPCYSLELCIQLGLPFPPFISLLSLAICKASHDNHFAFLHFFFFGMTLITVCCTRLWISIHSSSSILSDLIPWIIHHNFYLNDLVVFPTFFNLSLNFAIRSSWSEP